MTSPMHQLDPLSNQKSY
ncbi:hypothetical protein FWK35_00012956 [Aphis craccivora]|uniref:Uncharacterized protein n=1 Tax=Aphis craccivora TaxID=307492 RepID=A0A6G0YY98_APHCR|nr:hypothetical protein FWK35_00012956 [Aphis craccivora]